MCKFVDLHATKSRPPQFLKFGKESNSFVGMIVKEVWNDNLNHLLMLIRLFSSMIIDVFDLNDKFLYGNDDR